MEGFILIWENGKQIIKDIKVVKKICNFYIDTIVLVRLCDIYKGVPERRFITMKFVNFLVNGYLVKSEYGSHLAHVPTVYQYAQELNNEKD